MTRALKLLAILFAVSFIPAAAHAQTAAVVCRTVSDANALSGDEQLFANNQACKMVSRIAPAVTPATSKKKAAALAHAPALPATASCRSLEDTNNFLYSGEQIIGTQACKMVAVAVPSAQPATAAPAINPSAPSVSAGASNAVVAAKNTLQPGMYVGFGTEYKKITGQPIDFQKEPSKLASFHVKSAKEAAQLAGPHAQILTGPSPMFYFIPGKDETEAGVRGGDVVLVQLKVEKDHRALQVEDAGTSGAGKNFALAHEIDITRAEVNPGVYKLSPNVTLGPGEYGLYLARGESMPPFLFDFTVH